MGAVTPLKLDSTTKLPARLQSGDTLDPAFMTAGAMNSAYTSGTSGSVTTTTEVVIGTVTLTVGNGSSKVRVAARVNMTKDTGTTARVATIRVRRGTTTDGTQVGQSSVITSTGVASTIYGPGVVMVEDSPGAGSVSYVVTAQNSASATTTASAWELEAVELTGAVGPTGAAGVGAASMTLQSAQTSAYTFVLGDAGTATPFNLSSAANATIPANASVAFPVGTILYAVQTGSAAVTFVGAAGVTVNAPWGAATGGTGDWRCAIKTATDTWSVL